MTAQNIISSNNQQPAQQVQQVQQPAQPAQQPAQQVQQVQQVQQPAQPTGNAEASIIQQLQTQNAALMQQNEMLNAQVVRMVQGGAQFNQQVQQPAQQVQQSAQPAQPAYMQFASYEFPPVYGVGDGPLNLNTDVSLESLAGEIGKKAE